MKRFVEGVERGQSTLFPERLEDWIGDDNPVRVVDVLSMSSNLAASGLTGLAPRATGRPVYHPLLLLKLYIYGYLNRVQSSRHPAGGRGGRIWRNFRAAHAHRGHGGGPGGLGKRPDGFRRRIPHLAHISHLGVRADKDPLNQRAARRISSCHHSSIGVSIGRCPMAAASVREKFF